MRGICRAIAQATPHGVTKQRVAQMLGDLCGDTTPQQITPLKIELLVGMWRELAQSSRRAYHYQLRAMLRLLDRPDLAGIAPKIRRSRAHYPAATPEEIARLETLAPAWLRAAIIIAADTGLRRADVLALSEQHINKGEITIVMQKTKEPVTVPVSPKIAALIAALPPAPPHTPILERAAGRKVTGWMLDGGWQRLRKRAGIRNNVSMHSLRHAIALKVYQSTKDITAVQQLLGHRELGATAAYLEHHEPRKLRQIMQQIWTPKHKTP